jgi:glycerophosphoryl diester phosphodiesterase
VTPVIIAHRGASRAERENTVAAMRRARRDGADAVELDIRRCADDTLVVHHDARLEDGRALCDLPATVLPEYVSRLDAALDACAGMWVNVEIKNDDRDPDVDPADTIADAVVDALRRRGEPQRWLISSFRRSTIDRCHALAPEIRTAWLCDEVPVAALDDLAAAGHHAIHPRYTALDLETLAACRRAALAVNVWTCDDPDDMLRLARWGVDGICTNVPDLAVRLLRR